MVLRRLPELRDGVLWAWPKAPHPTVTCTERVDCWEQREREKAERRLHEGAEATRKKGTRGWQ